MFVIIGNEIIKVMSGQPIGVHLNKGEREQIGNMSDDAFGIYVQYFRKDEDSQGMTREEAKEYVDRLHVQIEERLRGLEASEDKE